MLNVQEVIDFLMMQDTDVLSGIIVLISIDNVHVE